MISPLIVGTSVALLAPQNRKRVTLMLQNTGATNSLYVKKVPLNANPASVVPSATNYDFIIYARAAEDPERIKVNSVCAFVAVASAATTTVAVMETVKVGV